MKELNTDLSKDLERGALAGMRDVINARLDSLKPVVVGKVTTTPKVRRSKTKVTKPLVRGRKFRRVHSQLSDLVEHYGNPNRTADSGLDLEYQQVVNIHKGKVNAVRQSTADTIAAEHTKIFG